MREAPVGWQCAACVKHGARISPTVRWRPSGGSGRLGNTRLTPMVAVLIAINVLVFIWEESSGTILYSGFGLRPSPCNRAQCDFALLPIAVRHGQWYRLITAAFLHEGWEHILLNMITLAIVGPAVEAELGKIRFVAVYMVAAIGGSVASYLLSSEYELGLGASGAIFGVMGAYYVLARKRRWDLSAITALVVINLLLGFTVAGIDWRAHLGGLLSGAAVCFALDRLAADRHRGVGPTLQVVGGTAIVAAAVMVLVLLTLLPPGHVNLS